MYSLSLNKCIISNTRLGVCTECFDNNLIENEANNKIASNNLTITSVVTFVQTISLIAIGKLVEKDTDIYDERDVRERYE
jgi:hypothetical protein